MLKRELKVNFKSFMIWTSILLGIFLVIFLVYPSIMNSENASSIKEMMKVFPEQMLKAFNMDITAIDTAFGWFKSEGYVFILLITGCFSSLLGSNILLKEESEKTIEFLHSKPITREKIVTSKIVCGIIYIVAMVLVLGIFNYIGFLITGDFDVKIFLYLSISPLFSSLCLFFISLFLSTFFHKTKKTLGISLGIVFLSYFLLVISGMSETVEFLKYFSVYSLSNARLIITEGFIHYSVFVATVIILILLAGVTYFRYHQKELV